MAAVQKALRTKSRRTESYSLILPVFLLFLSCVWIVNSQDPSALLRQWMPFAAGDRWIYEYEIRGGDRQKPAIERWQQAEVVAAIETVPEGVLIKRTVEFLNKTAAPRRMRSDEADILVRGNCLYYLSSWPGSARDIANFRQVQRNGGVPPNVCFPLTAGRTWGDPNKGRDLWAVAGLGPKKPDDPVSVTPQAWRLEANLASGDDDCVWFQKGLGMTAARTFHNGTYGDAHLRLLRFEPAGALR
jgi:hypothetical protein